MTPHAKAAPTRDVAGLLAALALALGAAAPAAHADPAPVSDAEAPRGAVGGLSSPASGTLALSVRSTDAGSGLASAQARVDGAVVAAADLGGAHAVEDLPLTIATPLFGDGAHQLQVSVTDVAGNTAVLVDQPLVFNNTPLDRSSTVMLTLGSGDVTTPPGGAGGGATGASGGSGSVGGAGGTGSGGGPACRTPRLSMFLKDKPLRVSRGVPVLRRNGRYRFSGTLTCASGKGRVRAPSGIVVGLYNQLGKKTYKKSGVTTRAGGALSTIVAYPSSRVLDFRYTSIDGSSTRVRIRITVSAKRKGR
ncbi:hypothetical protein [Baekduia sp. Peel2402]|uniref:hypothetical protein n=1 Tax=Baekduia sp. Peel2402 TaxID=3458296 RepID=UPI00403E9DCB